MFFMYFHLCIWNIHKLMVKFSFSIINGSLLHYIQRHHFGPNYFYFAVKYQQIDLCSWGISNHLNNIHKPNINLHKTHVFHFYLIWKINIKFNMLKCKSLNVKVNLSLWLRHCYHEFVDNTDLVDTIYLHKNRSLLPEATSKQYCSCL